MSSSMFVESSSLPADSNEYASTSDSNLVVVYGKNGISFDDKGLENLIEEKKISSISVIRLTSPTPSMEDEEEEAEKLEEMFRRQEIGSADESGDSKYDDNCSSGDGENDTVENTSNGEHDNDEKESNKESDNELNEENKLKNKKLSRRRGRQPNPTRQKKNLRRRRHERPEIVGLRLEEFYPPEDANEIIKEALKIAGLGSDKKAKEAFDFQLLVIQNDHCYTPFTSPTQMKAKLAADKLESEKQAANRKTSVLHPTQGKQLFVRKKPQAILQKTVSLSNKPSTSNAIRDKSFTIANKIKKDPKERKSLPDEDYVEDDDDIRSSFDENEDDGASEDEETDISGSDESAETDNDRDSDLDFDVNNPKGRKRKVKLLKSLKRSVGSTKALSKSRRFYSQDEPVDLPNKSIVNTSSDLSGSPSTATTTPNTFIGVQRQKSLVKVLSDPARITVRSTPSKVLHIGGHANLLSPAVAALPPIPRKQHENKSTINITGTTTNSNISHKAFVLKGPMEQKNAVLQASPQTHKEIMINKQVMASPKTKGFTDLNTLIEQTEKKNPIKIFQPSTSKSSHTAIITSVVTLTPSTSKGFMPILMETAAKNQLPSQISIQTHQSSSELEAEHDKQLDLINSIVQDELKKSNEMTNEKTTNINENIPELVKMLESTEKNLVSTKNVPVPTHHQNIIQVGSGGAAAVNKTNNCNPGNANVVNLSLSSTNNNTVGGIDITNASLMATPDDNADDDDDLPDDILQQVVELIKDDKTLQEAVEKQVFGTGSCNDPVVVNSNTITVNQNPPPLAPISQSPASNTIRIQEIPHSSKSIIEMAISNLPTSSAAAITKPTTTIPMRTAASHVSKTSPLVRKEPIQIIRGNGRVITLPPIEAPTTRAKRRAQAQPSADSSSLNTSIGSTVSTLNESSLDSSMHSSSSMSVIGGINVSAQDKKLQDTTNRRRGSKENIFATTSAVANQKATRKTAAKKPANKTQLNKSQVETEATESEEDDDDPNKLWCICRQPHNNRFMICCDVCEDWFHGTCVCITKAMGLEMEQKGIDWTCPKCVKKIEEKKQPKITEMLLKKPTTAVNQPDLSTVMITPIVTATPAATTIISAKTSDSKNFNTQARGSIIQHMVESPKVKLQSGQFVNLKDFNSGTNKPHILQQTSTVTTAPTTVTTAGQKKLYVATNQPLKLTTQQGTPIRTITVVKQIPTPQHHQQQHHNIKIIKTISPAQSTTQNTVATAAINTANEASSSTATLCIVCKKVARSNSIYCSDDCIRKHAQNALNVFMAKQSQSETPAPSSPLNKTATDDKAKKKSKGLFEDLLSMADRKPKIERVNVYERKSGRVLTGSSAPTIANLKKWLQDNPTFEVIQPGSSQAIDLEKKQKLRTQHSPSPTIMKSATSPPPLKMFPLSSSVIHKPEASSPQTPGHSPHTQTKANRSITDFMKRSSTSSTPRPSTPKQLQKYPQQVGIKPDKEATSKPTEETKTPREKPSGTKRQTSTESNSKSNTSNDGEPIRLVIRRTLKEQLLLRYKEETQNASTETEAKNNDDTKTENNIPKLTDEEIEEFAKATELEMYNYFNRDTGIKYKAKYRSLVFNIKDRKNHTLFAKICSKLISPKQLVRMSPEELASQELAQWREQEAKHQLEMIKKSELDLISCAKNYVLKTHKGEEVIEGKSSEYANVDVTIPVEDVVSALNKSDLLEPEATVTTRKESHMTSHWSDPDSSFLSHSFLSESHTLQDDDKMKSSTSSTSSKEKDKEREKEKIKDRERDREREKRHKSKDRHRDKSRSRKRSRSHSRSRSRERDRGEKRHKSAHRDDRRDREDRGREKERNKERSERDHHHQHHHQHHSDGNDKKPLVEKKSSVSLKQANKKQQELQKATINPMDTYNLIDQILESTKTVEEAANIVSERDKDKEIESVRKSSITPVPAQSTTSTTSTTSSSTLTSLTSSSSGDSTPVVDITAESDQEPTSTVSIPTPPHDPYSRFIACDSSSPFTGESGSHRYNITSLWTGNINMVDVTSFQLSLQPIVGTSMGLAKLLPKELDVVGRIGQETVWDYISKIKKSPNKEIVVIRLIPASESETSAYKILYEYLDNRNRLGVIKSISSQIKDFYIYPLGAGKNIPDQLQPSERVDFYDDPYRPDVLVGIIIRVVVSGGGGGGKRPNPILSQTIVGAASTSAGLNKFTSRSNDIDSFTPPGSPKPKRRRQSIARKADDIDVDAIIKAPIVAKTQKAAAKTAALSKANDADEPYSPGGSSDDDLPLLPVKLPSSMDPMQTAEDELKRKMEEINRQIAAQEMEIAGLLTGEPTTFGSSSSSSSNVLANISIPSNLTQILASIKAAGQDVVPPPPPLIGSLVKTSTTKGQNEEQNPDESMESKKDTGTATSNTTSRLAKLSEAELLSMVPDDIIITPNKPARHEEPPPPGV